MSRTVFVVLAVLALLATVSAQSSTSSSSTPFSKPLSSSSSYVVPSSSTGSPVVAASNSSTGSPVVPVTTANASSSTGMANNNSVAAFSSSSSSSAGGLPAGSFSVLFSVTFSYPITTANINQTAQSLQSDIIYNLVTLANLPSNASLIGNVFVTSVNGTVVAGTPTSRRLLQTGTKAAVTYIILGTATQATGISTQTLVNQFVSAASTGSLQSVYTPGASIPQQTITPVAVGPVISSSTGLGYSGASSAASASVALLFAAVAALALLL